MVPLASRQGSSGLSGSAIKSIGFGKIPVTTTHFPDGTGEPYSPTFLTLGATYAKALTDRISVGLTANLVTERILETSASGVAFNIGIQYQNLAAEGLNLGIAVKNIGTNMQFAGSDLLPQDSRPDCAGRSSIPWKQPPTKCRPASKSALAIRTSSTTRTRRPSAACSATTTTRKMSTTWALNTRSTTCSLSAAGIRLLRRRTRTCLTRPAISTTTLLVPVVHYAVSGLDLSFDYAYRHMKYFTGNNVVTLKVGF